MARTITRNDAGKFNINHRLKWEPPADYLPGEPLAKRVCEFLSDQIADWREREPDNLLVHDVSERTVHGKEWTIRDELSKAGHLLAHARRARDAQAIGQPIEWFLIDIGYRVAELNYIEAWRKQILLDDRQIKAQEKAENAKKENAEWRRDEFRRLMDEYNIHNEEAPRILAKLGNSSGFEELRSDLPNSRRRKLDIIRAAKKNQVP